MIVDMKEAQSNQNVVASEDDISILLQADPWRMNVLRAAETLDLPNWWIGAGFLRNTIWDALEGIKPGAIRDVDLVYFDGEKTDPEIDWAYDERMKHEFPFAVWEVRNQARMHYINNFKAYTSTEDGIASWIETATCIAVRLESNKLRYLFCYGTDDLFDLIARPTPAFSTPEMLPFFYKRVEKKQWRKKWPHLRVEV